MTSVETDRVLDLGVGPGPSGFRRRVVPRAPVLAVLGLLVAAGALLPLAYLTLRASEAGLDRVVEVVTAPRSIELLQRTALLATAVTLASIALAVPLAWLTVRTDLPLRRTIAVVAALPLAIPTYVGAYTYIAAIGPRGMLRDWLGPIGVDELPSIYGFFGAWLTLTLFSYPYVLLTVRAALRRLDPALEDASRTLGRGPVATFVHVVLPQLRPAIVAGSLLVALYTLSDFGAVSLMRFDSFTRVIFTQYRASLDRSTAAILGLMLVALTLVVLAVEARTRGGRRYHATQATGGPRRPPVAPLGAWRWPAFAACCALVLLAVVVPLGVIGYWLVRGAQAGEPLRLTSTLAANSLRAALIGSLAAVAAAWPVALLSVRHPGRVARLVERASYAGYALPGIVVALALVFFGARVTPQLYQTLFLLAFAYVVLFLPQAVGGLRASLLQVPPSLEEASRSLGRGRIATTWRVLVPLVRSGALAGFALVFLTCMKELPATLLLAPTGYSTLATQVWSATSEAFFGRAAAPALALVVLSALPMAVLVLRDEDRRGG